MKILIVLSILCIFTASANASAAEIVKTAAQMLNPTMQSISAGCQKGAGFLASALHLLGVAISELLETAGKVVGCITQGTGAMLGSIAPGTYHVVNDITHLGSRPPKPHHPRHGKLITKNGPAGPKVKQHSSSSSSDRKMA